MTSDQLTSEQCRRICEALFPSANYLVRLKNRREQKRFAQSDPLYQLVVAAYKAVNRLRNDVQFRSCDGVTR